MGYARAEQSGIDMERQEITGRLKIDSEMIEKTKEQVKAFAKEPKNLFT